MVAIFGNINLSGGRVRGLQSASFQDEPIRRADAGSLGGMYINTIRTVSAPPISDLGVDGDYAINPTAQILYGPKALGVWPSGVSFKGANGTNGTNGAAGLSAYQVAVANGFAGTAPEWLLSLIGADGAQGIAGPAGAAYTRRVQSIAKTSGGSVAVDWSAYDEVRVTLTANTTFTFSGATDGQGCILTLKQDSSGGRSVSLPSSVRLNSLITSYQPTQDAGKADKIGFVYNATDAKYDFVSIVPGL